MLIIYLKYFGEDERTGDLLGAMFLLFIFQGAIALFELKCVFISTLGEQNEGVLPLGEQMSQRSYFLTVLVKLHVRRKLICLTISRPNSGLGDMY